MWGNGDISILGHVFNKKQQIYSCLNHPFSSVALCFVSLTKWLSNIQVVQHITTQLSANSTWKAVVANIQLLQRHAVGQRRQMGHAEKYHKICYVATIPLELTAVSLKIYLFFDAEMSCSRGSQHADRLSRDERTLSSRRSSLIRTWFFKLGACKTAYNHIAPQELPLSHSIFHYRTGRTITTHCTPLSHIVLYNHIVYCMITGHELISLLHYPPIYSIITKVNKHTKVLQDFIQDVP